ncbi:uncharacterized protein LOC117812036 isoform X2 [Notolabrus celidotus]|uniref:uncharacterized protein LOC117812036 isoform X2 n=1 Tax=Notolabrus celidotus TaxID=1203425 RepID=UPI00148F88D8|nr:uncharacterized protein LOC117812036 isoform X2 [Notolabrus celidotus]
MVRCHRWSVWTRTHDLRELPSRWTLRFIAANTSSSVIQDAALPNMFTVEKTPPRLRLTQMCLEITCPATPWALHLHVLSGRGGKDEERRLQGRWRAMLWVHRFLSFYETIKAEFYMKLLKNGLCFNSVWSRSLNLSRSHSGAKKNYDLWIKKGAVLVCLHEAASQPHCHSSRCQSTGYHSL